jgi:ABC-type nickel/cobalt efflux system permease component RcnA
MDPSASLSLYYIPTAVALGALHALEPGHAKTLTAAYLIGVRGTRRDAVLLGLSVAATHSGVVIAISAFALWLGREAFTDQATRVLQLTSGAVVVLLGCWLIYRRWPRPVGHNLSPQCAHDHAHDHPHHHMQAHAGVDHHAMSDDEHACAHAKDLPEYVTRGERPTTLQIVTFGAAGGLIPCPQSISVMLLALSIGAAGLGFLTVLAFSVGLAVTLVGVGLAVVTGLTQLAHYGRFSWFTRQASLISAIMVLFSGCIALAMTH